MFSCCEKQIAELKEELKEIREKQRQKSETKIAPELEHIVPPVKKRSEKEAL